MFTDIPPESIIVSTLPRSVGYVALLLKCIRERSVFCPLAHNLPTAKSAELIARINPNYIVSTEGTIKTGAPRRSSEGLGYIIHTSGSTGKPKGVLCDFDPLIRVVTHQASRLRPQKAAWILSPGFDASLSDILSTVIHGGELHIPPFRATQLKNLGSYFKEHNIDTCDIPPSLLAHMKRADYPTLKSVVCGGEIVADSLTETWGDVLHIAYGPTEAAVCSNMAHPKIPSGGPWLGDFLPGCEGMVFNGSNLQPISEEPGELWLHGQNLARGYLGDKSLTAARFVIRNGNRYFRTGDIVDGRSGQLRFLGRNDRQVKIRGNLVCPEEIESALAPLVGGALVVKQHEKLVLYSQRQISLAEVNKYISDRLPSHMLISRVEDFAEIPRLENEKPNFKELERNG